MITDSLFFRRIKREVLRGASDKEIATLARMLVDKKKEEPRPLLGRWSEEEKRTMVDVFSNGYSSEIVEEATKRLNRTKSQVRSMAGNMGLRK